LADSSGLLRPSPAVPLSNVTGTHSYCAADDGVLRDGAPASLAAASSYANCLSFSPVQN